MNKMVKLLFGQVFPWFLATLGLFTLVFILGDIIINLQEYLRKEVSFAQILMVELYLVPQSVSWSLSISLLFGTSFTFGNLQENNELIAVFNSGISLLQFSIPVILLGLVLSVAQFFFEDHVVIPTIKIKNEMQDELIGTNSGNTEEKNAILDQGGRVVYFFDYFNEDSNTLFSPIVLMRDENMDLLYRLDAISAQWSEEEELWEFKTVRFFEYENQNFSEVFYTTYTDPRIIEEPDTFRRNTTKIEELPLQQAMEMVEELRDNGLPYLKAESQVYRRFGFVLTPFIVILLACPLGGRFRKNVLILSLSVSLVAAVSFYFLQLTFDVLSESGVIAPLAGPILQVLIGIAAGIFLFVTARN